MTVLTMEPTMQLKAFQVGDYDMVAHYTPEGAAAFLCEYAGYPPTSSRPRTWSW